MLDNGAASGRQECVLVTPSNASQWRAIFRCARDADAGVPPSTSPATASLRAAVSACGVDDRRLAAVMQSLLRQSARHLSGADLASAVVLCCRVVEVSPGPREVIRDSSLLVEHLPRASRSVEFEPLLEALLWEASRLGPDLAVQVAVSKTESEAPLTFLQWLQQLARYLSEQSLPIPVTSSAVSCFRALLSFSPCTVEAVVGQVASTILYNVDQVDPVPFWSDLLNHYAKLRQIPKLIAKLFIATCSTMDRRQECLALRPLSPECLSAFANAVTALSLAQCVDLWKTFLYHAGTAAEMSGEEERGKRSATLCILEDFMSCFLRSAAVVDFTVPRTSQAKVASLLSDTFAIVTSLLSVLPRVRAATVELGMALRAYRNTPLPEEFFSKMGEEGGRQDVQLKLSILSGTESEVKKIAWKLPAKEGNCQELVRNLDLISEHLQGEQVIKLARTLFGRERRMEEAHPWLHSDVLQESRLLQRGVLVSLLVHLSDVFDVDPTCEEVMKPFTKRQVELINLSEEKLEMRLKRSFQVLESALLSDTTNPSLDPKFYFRVPVRVLEALPLEAMDGNNHLASVLATLILLAVSTHSEVNDQLLRVLARCLDPTWRSTKLLTVLNAGKLLAWFSRLRYYGETAFLKQCLSSLCQNLVRYIRDYERSSSGLSQSLDKLAASTLGASELSSGLQSVLPCLVLLEALSKPLIHRDTTREKLELCEALMARLAEHFRTGFGLSCFCQASSPRPATSQWHLLALEGLTALLHAWNSLPEGSGDGEERLRPDPESWLPLMKHAVACAIEWCGGDDNDGGGDGRGVRDRFLVAALESEGAVRKCFPKMFVTRLWKKRVVSRPSSCSDELLKKALEALDSDDLQTTLVSVQKSNVEGYSSFAFAIRICSSLVSSSKPLLVAARRTHLEEVHPILQSVALARDGADVALPAKTHMLLSVLALERGLLFAEKPQISSASEGRCLTTALQLDLTRPLRDGNHQDFLSLWRAAYEVVSSAFLRRLNSLVLSRIPTVMSVLRLLLAGVVEAATIDGRTQRSLWQLDPGQLREVSLCAADFDRLLEHVRHAKADFARVSPYLVSDVVSCLCARALHSPVREALIDAVRKLLDLCDKHSVDFLFATLSEAAREVFRKLLQEYNAFHKYKGKV